MKDRIQKILRMMLALALLLTSIGLNNAFAAGNGSITVNGTTKDKTYGIYKIFDLTYKDDNVSYTIADGWKDFFAKGNGKEFIVDKNNSNNSLNPIVVDGKVKYINITDDNVAKFAKTAMGEIADKKRQAVQKATGETLKFTGLDLGYYLVHPEGASEAATGQSSIVSLTSTKPTGEVTVKGIYPTIKKEAKSKSADYGEKVSFTITGKVPDPTGYKKYEYVLKDTLPKGLSIDANSIKVTIGGVDNTANITKAVSGQDLSVTFNILELVKKSSAIVGQDIKLTYDTTVNKDFVLGNQGQENKAHVEFSNDPKNGETKDKTPEEKVKIYSGKIKVTKCAKNDKTKKLEGAQFVLKNSDGKFYKLDTANNEKKVSWVENLDQATVLTSDKKGELEFTGIKAGTYKLKETKAPDGYNLLTEEKEVVLKDGSNAADTVTMEATSDVENSSGTELPKVGGAGTKLFALIGGAVILYAALSLIRRKIKLQER
ncbi:conserved repeat protein [Peptostreptococcus anaerobius 653-L]|uniref:Conserved repeat protein n=1 Tax=Peptostreptococcus anaerobius 653-L TaxID=596329 RepID=D3MTV2_9FIRM|nr:SpaH/EbpB family LPXTG-anchored major pilin [Peptostreptococcus anaerobius]EFD04422.1 conserved repeat protein [Peptostreptococcus anaerobius 653-L]